MRLYTIWFVLLDAMTEGVNDYPDPVYMDFKFGGANYVVASSVDLDNPSPDPFTRSGLSYGTAA